MTCNFGEGIVLCTVDRWRVVLDAYCPWCDERRRCLAAAVFSGWCGNDYICGTCGSYFNSDEPPRKLTEDERAENIAKVAAKADPACWTCHDTGDARPPDMPAMDENDLDPKPCACAAGQKLAAAIRERKKMITIKPSPTADTRTCDWSKVEREQLYVSSVAHLADVRAGMALFADMVRQSGERHDFDKLAAIDHFHADFRTGFKETGWWDNHRKINRHHLAEADGVPEDVNLVDVLEFITDCVMAGMARSGSVYDLHLSDELLQRAFQNTVALLKASVTVER